MRFGADEAKAALPFTATRKEKINATIRSARLDAIAGSTWESNALASDVVNVRVWSRMVSWMIAVPMATRLPIETLVATTLTVTDPAAAKRAVMPMAATAV